MITESVVVLLLTLLISYIYMRRGKRGMAAAILPLAVLPCCSLLGALLYTRLPPATGAPYHWRILFVVVGLLCGGALLGTISVHIHKKAARRLYLLLCGGFTILFAFLEILAILG